MSAMFIMLIMQIDRHKVIMKDIKEFQFSSVLFCEVSMGQPVVAFRKIWNGVKYT